jgi:hypothetical protein
MTDNEDPWLHWEYAETLLALNPDALREASPHFQVAAIMFMQLGGQKGAVPGRVSPSRHYSELDGVTPLSPGAARSAAASVIARWRGATSDRRQRCQLQLKICHIKLQVGGVLGC